MRRATMWLALALTLMACGDSTGPDDSFPAIAGIYDYSGAVHDVPSAAFTGTLTIVDDSRETQEFTGTYALTLSGGGLAPSSFAGDIVNARVTRDGDVLFDLDASDYHHTGTLNGGRITGSWSLTGSTSSFTGTFTAIRR